MSQTIREKMWWARYKTNSSDIFTNLIHQIQFNFVYEPFFKQFARWIMYSLKNLEFKIVKPSGEFVNK